MNAFEINKRINEIVDALNALEYEKEESLELNGALFPEMYVDFVNDERAADGNSEEYVPSESELSEIQAACDRNCSTLKRIEEEQSALKGEYFSITGTNPHLSEATNRYMRSWYEKL